MWGVNNLVATRAKPALAVNPVLKSIFYDGGACRKRALIPILLEEMLTMDNTVIDEGVSVVDADSVEAPAESEHEVVAQAGNAGQANPDESEEASGSDDVDEVEDVEGDQEDEEPEETEDEMDEDTEDGEGDVAEDDTDSGDVEASDDLSSDSGDGNGTGAEG
jgi:hypothetical protein